MQTGSSMSMQISFQQILSRFLDFVDIFMQLCCRVAEGSERMVASS